MCLLRSVALLAPLLSEEAKRTPFWKSWVAHVRVLEASLRTEYTLKSIEQLDQLVQKHHELFLKVAARRVEIAACP